MTLVVPAERARAARGRAEAFFLEGLREFPGVLWRVERARIARPVLATGPFAAWSGRVTADGAALVGDAADFFDPFTGEGIYCALRGAELLSAAVLDGVDRKGPRHRAGAGGVSSRSAGAPSPGKWAVERLVGYAMEFPRLFDRAVGRLDRRGMAHTFIGVTGDFVPARAVLNPLFLARMVL